MIPALRCLFAAVLLAMLAVTGWASSRVALWDIPREVLAHPWFIATLFDTYFAFLAFWLWLAWRERRWLPRVAWLAAILLLGNIAMAAYMLVLLFRLPADAKVDRLFTREDP
jgi:drug/metabolite transporter (DMT)-like permease